MKREALLKAADNYLRFEQPTLIGAKGIPRADSIRYRRKTDRASFFKGVEYAYARLLREAQERRGKK